MLLRSTPEGAREFLVPTRGTPNTPPAFYALQQSPQQPKQLLMVSGVTDRYYQFSKCFRDEDGRKDRQPEFTQIDMEMSFVSGAEPSTTSAWRIGGTEVRDTVEGMVRAMWASARRADTLPSGAFPVLSYEHVMAKYGADKPDLRFGLHITNLGPALRSSPIQALDVLICPQYTHPKGSVKVTGRQMAPLLLNKEGAGSSIEHFKAELDKPDVLADLLVRKSRHVAAVQKDASTLADVLRTAMNDACLGETTDSDLVATGKCDVFLAQRTLPAHGGSTELGDLRLRLAELLSTQYPTMISTAPRILWVTEFPLFTRSDEDKKEAAHGRWSSSHHPFTAPAAEDVPQLTEALASPTPDPAVVAGIRGQHYDLVLNGSEIGGGSVRIHDPQLQEAVLRRVLELSKEEVQRFAHLLHALHSGAPPHAGIALGTFANSHRVRSVHGDPLQYHEYSRCDRFPQKCIGGGPALCKSCTPVGRREGYDGCISASVSSTEHVVVRLAARARGDRPFGRIGGIGGFCRQYLRFGAAVVRLGMPGHQVREGAEQPCECLLFQRCDA